MKLIETRRIDTDKVRAMCIRNDYYTCGTNEDYCKMFQKCGLNYGVLEIATDILEHSNKERLMKQCGCSEREILENICFEIVNDCCWTEIDFEE